MSKNIELEMNTIYLCVKCNDWTYEYIQKIKNEIVKLILSIKSVLGTPFC